ncbi:MAG: hypothetical protein ABIG37_02460 [Nanoarchaeota archaeon]|nr:hypothetical protein [Nanoarchaeota archaeon]
MGMGFKTYEVKEIKSEYKIPSANYNLGSNYVRSLFEYQNMGTGNRSYENVL